MVEAIDEQARRTIEYPEKGEAQIAETTFSGRAAGRPPHPADRPRVAPMAGLASLRVHHRPHRNITIVESEHRDHAVVEQVIVDRKDRTLEHFLSGEWGANGPWTVLAALAHNLLRWTQLIGRPNSTVRAAAPCAGG
jgi:hypothetical protein